MKLPEYVTVKELKEILANFPDDYYICVEGGEDKGGEWGELYAYPTVPDFWRTAERTLILQY